MSGIELYIDYIDGRPHAAACRHGKLSDLYVDATDRTLSWGATYMGKVIKIDNRLGAAIIDLGNGQTGLLMAKHVYVPSLDATAARPEIGAMLTGGQAVLVQIKSEAGYRTQYDGKKLPRLTMKLCVMGQYLIYCPASARGVPKKTPTPAQAELAASLPNKGWIVKERASKASRADIDTEAKTLLKEWQELKEAAEGGDKTPRLIKVGPDTIRRVMNDYSALMFDHIYVGNKKLFDRMSEWCAAFNPTLAGSKRLKLFKPLTPKEKLYDEYDLYSELEYLKDSRIDLPGGGWIVIDYPHAFTVIDVNQGSGPGPSEVNQQAALEISRQIRLRNLSGAILIDFIGMNQKSERSDLVETLANLFVDDGAVTQVHGFTRLGIIELTRKRRSATYMEKTMVTLGKSL